MTNPSVGPAPLDPGMFDPVCPSALVPFRLGDKWATLILRCLQDGPRRFSELKVPLRGVTAKSLTHSLRALERDGFVVRTEHEGAVRRVDYALTTLGRGLLGPLDTACAWTREHWDELIDAQEAGLARAVGRH
ncbi:DNA-binding HxlR family transcriptional regulator [Kitasatospora herbaricolor]|uniref:winged helix-turn-helix transcriptional regulator n=1 Tax=Kitasatospora herbaricolor TaxID=68217 RepID=UPI001748C215|nr:helix-turn-helix domain-containing protein [Kitasatospora herbaricolor]MDQ0313097.1 DNA-binding HxlR family transcriptional regulator [Kitasatospora herbaricolor]